MTTTAPTPYDTHRNPLYANTLDTLTNKPVYAAPLSTTARHLLRERYLNADDQSSETPDEFFRRVATALAEAEAPQARQPWADAFYTLLSALEFHPGSRTLANISAPNPQLSNCFVFPLEDSQEHILNTFADSSLVKSHGGGCGFNYSNIRPRGDKVRGVDGLAVGPVGLMKLFNDATSLFRQKGRYESGNMAVLNVDHPDVLDFIEAKTTDGNLSLTNISLGITDDFMHAVNSDSSWNLVNPRTGHVTTTLPARHIFDRACQLANETGDPGLIFLDAMNRSNPLHAAFGDICATNPCGEIGLYPYEACNLGYLNLTRFLLPPHERTDTNLFDEPKLRTVVAAAIRMIDNAITLSRFPVPAITDAVAANRRIGLGVTGWADCLADADIPYDSEQALTHADQLAGLLRAAADAASLALAEERGPFPNAAQSVWADDPNLQPRNVAVLALPPSGNNALIFDTSFSIEPFFAMTYTQRVFGDQEIQSVNSLLLDKLALDPSQATALMNRILNNNGSVRGLDDVPDQVQRVFKTAHDIAPGWHVRMQAAFQRHVDNAVTKTVNLPSHATPSDVADVYTQAWKLGCKGITVYRDRSRSLQAIDWASSTPTATTPDTPNETGRCTVCVD